MLLNEIARFASVLQEVDEEEREGEGGGDKGGRVSRSGRREGEGPARLKGKLQGFKIQCLMMRCVCVCVCVCVYDILYTYVSVYYIYIILHNT